MSKVMKRPGRIGSEFMLAKGRGRCKVGRKETGKKKKKQQRASGRVMERKRTAAVLQTEYEESRGNWREDRYSFTPKSQSTRGS